MQHYFVEQSLTVGDQLTLPTNIKRHFFNVLRSQVGDQVELVDTTQQVFIGEATDVDTGTVRIIDGVARQADLPVAATIICGLAKQGKPELIVQKATELGVANVIFMPLERSIVKWGAKSAKKIERLQEVAVSAAEQSHRNSIPRITYLSGLTDLADYHYDCSLVAYEEAAKQGEEAQLVKSIKQLASGQTVSCVFGPEGGISESEINWLTEHGYQPVGLGPRILRTETAPLYFLSAVSVILELSRG